MNDNTQNGNPLVTGEQRRGLIEWAKKEIAEYEIACDEIPFGLDAGAANQLTACRITLAAMEAAPIAWMIHTPATNVTYVELRKSSVDVVISMSQRENFELVVTPLFTTPPIPALNPVVKPYLPADCDRTEAHYKYCEAIRAAGGTIAGSGE